MNKNVLNTDLSGKVAVVTGAGGVLCSNFAKVLARAGAKESELMDIHAVRVGSIGFAGAPYEMFGINGQYIKERSPYAATIVVSCCNDARSYLASDLAFSHGSYEVDIRRYPRGTAEKMAEQFVEMLAEMK